MTALTPDAALIGCALAGFPDPDALFEIVQPSDLEHPHDEWIWSAAMQVVTSGTTLSPTTVLSALGRVATKLPGGPTYLSELHMGAPNPMEALTHAKDVQARAVRRRITTAAMRIGQMATDVDDVGALADMARSEIDRAAQTGHAHELVRMADVLPQVLTVAEHGEEMGLSTGWEHIDRLIYGLQPGKLVVVGARPGGGKSLFGTNVTLEVAAHQRKPVLFCSLEMSSVELGRRMVSDCASVNVATMQTGKVTSEGWDRIAEKTNDLLSLPIFIEDDPIQSISSIRSAIIKLRREHEHVPLIIVDYLQMMQVSDSKANRAEKLGEVSRGLKIIAREFKTCVLAMAQVNREATKRADQKPTMADLRESGSIEADADVIIMLHRPEPEGTLIEALIEKNRAGPRGLVNLEIFGHLSRLSQATWSPTGGIS